MLYRSISGELTPERIAVSIVSQFSSAKTEWDVAISFLCLSPDKREGGTPVLIVRVTTLFMGAVDMSYFLKDKDVEFLPGCSAEHRLGPQEREVAPGRTVDVYEVFLRSRPNCVLAVTAIT